jgi:hypothetical protein
MKNDFQGRFTAGLIKLVITSGLTEQPDGTRAAIIPAGDIVDTMITFMGIMLRDSEGTRTPTQTRKTTDELARKLQRRIYEAKAQESPFETLPMGAVN